MDLWAKLNTYDYVRSGQYQYSLERILAVTNHFSKTCSRLNILDLGAGPGVQALHLAKLGHAVDAVEICPSMIKIFEAALDESDESVKSRVNLFSDDWFRKDAKWKRLQHYHALYALGNTIWNVGNRDSLISLFKDMSALIKPGGVFVFDLFPFDNLSDGPEPTFSPATAYGSTDRLYQKGFTCIRYPATGEMDLTLHVKWVEGKTESFEKENYHTYPFDDAFIDEVCRLFQFKLLEKTVEPNSSVPGLASGMYLWIIQKQ